MEREAEDLPRAVEPRGGGRSLPRREGAPRLMGWGGSKGGAGLAEEGAAVGRRGTTAGRHRNHAQPGSGSLCHDLRAGGLSTGLSSRDCLGRAKKMSDADSQPRDCSVDETPGAARGMGVGSWRQKGGVRAMPPGAPLTQCSKSSVFWVGLFSRGPWGCALG